jgi:SSS family solute:Na+ symporter
MVLASLFSLIYIWFGGFKAVIRTDIFQFVFMFLGFGLLLTYCWAELGSPVTLLTSLPEKHVTPLGGNTIQYVIVWFFIASWTFIDPGFYQRCAAAKTPEIAQKGILMSILFWGIFDALTLITGLYAVQLISPNNPLFSFPLLGKNILPPLVYGIFLAGIFATIMSTIDSLGFVNSFTFGRDIIGRLKGQHLNIKSIRMGLIVSTLLAWGLALIVPSVVKLFYTIGSIIIPGLIFPFLLNIWKPKCTVTSMLSTLWILVPVIISATWMGGSLIFTQPLLNIEPFYPGMISSLIMGYFIIK